MTNAVVSPDGERVAWVDESSYLRVADVDGTDARTYRTNLVDPDCWTPAWAPDSERVLVSRVVSAEPSMVTEVGVVELSTGKFIRVGDLKGCHPLWSADGKVLAFPDGATGRVMLTDQSGRKQRSIPGLGGNADRSCFDVASLSPDGSRIALRLRGPGEESGDVARELDVNAVLDTRTGRKLDLELGGRKLLQAYFQADGTLVARVGGDDRNVLVLLDGDGRKISETPEPTSLKGQQILGVAD
jgi:Tol biopolymer transport system component